VWKQLLILYIPASNSYKNSSWQQEEIPIYIYAVLKNKEIPQVEKNIRMELN